MAKLRPRNKKHHLRKKQNTTISDFFQKLLKHIAKWSIRFTRFSLPLMKRLRQYFLRDSPMLKKVIGFICFLLILIVYVYFTLMITFFASIAQGLLVWIWGKETVLAVNPLPPESMEKESIVAEENNTQNSSSNIVEEKGSKEIEKLSEEEQELIDLLTLSRNQDNLLLSYQRNVENDLEAYEAQLLESKQWVEERHQAVENLKEHLGIKEEMLDLEKQKIILKEMETRAEQNDKEDDFYTQQKEETERLKQLKLKEDIIAKRRENRGY